jgi:lipopolysaccharide/colanic/teichoic acid biosynthesis glycosyltransferase
VKTKRIFDLALCTVSAVVWLPTLLLGSLLVLVFSGRPVLYASMRKVSVADPVKIVKFRTMVRNAAEIVNRDTVPVQGDVRFLNIPPDSPLYTKPGHLLEMFGITELPQFFHVLRGQMSIVGNRPLPQNVMDCLNQEHSDAEDRFLTPAGLTGPAQLVGRSVLTDSERLELEGAYSRGCLRSYSPLLDLKILVMTVLIVLRMRPGYTVPDVLSMIDRHTGMTVAPPPHDLSVPKRSESIGRHNGHLGAPAELPATEI